MATQILYKDDNCLIFNHINKKKYLKKKKQLTKIKKSN